MRLASGKGTISKWLAKDFGLPTSISMGDLLRQSNDKRIRSLVTTGDLLSDELVMPLMRRSLEGKGQWILDGFPRTITQAKFLDSFCPPNLAICIQVPKNILLERMSSRWIHPASGRIYNDNFDKPKKDGFDDITGEPLIRRADDQTTESIKKRLDAFILNTQNIRPFYADRWIELHGQTSSEIYTQLKVLLRERIALRDNRVIPMEASQL